MRRRDFVTLFSVARRWRGHLPRARSRTDKSLVSGSLLPIPTAHFLLRATRRSLLNCEKLGFTEGKRLIEFRRADQGASKTFAAAAELIRSKADVVVTFGPEITLKAASAASQTIPIVMIAVNFDPIAGGYVSNIARPDRNITGLVSRAPELAVKQLELLVEAFPDEKPIAALWEPASAEQFDTVQRTAQSLHIELRSHKVENPPFDFDEAFRAIAQDGSRMVLVLSGGPSFGMQRAHIADLAIQHRLPTMFHLQVLCRGGRADVLRC